MTLAKAREKAGRVRELVLEGIDPWDQKKRAREDAKPKTLFGQFALDHLDSIEDGFKNPQAPPAMAQHADLLRIREKLVALAAGHQQFGTTLLAVTDHRDVP